MRDFFNPNNNPTELDDSTRDAFGLPSIEAEQALEQQHQAEARRLHEEQRNQPRIYQDLADPTEPTSADIRDKFNEARQEALAKATAKQREVDLDFAAGEFVKATRDYVMCPKNADLMVTRINKRNLPATHETFDQVWAEIKAEGIAVVKALPSIPPRPSAEFLDGGF